jgi:selenide, water dikinase
LDAVLGKLPRLKDDNVLVGFDKADDAGVYRLSPTLALVQTVDFFTPIVDDPYLYGEIAAANSLSDVYAMGGKPLSALSIVAFPEKEDLAILEQILQGGFAKMQEAGCVVIGGHSIRDEEIKFGYSVTGTIDPGKVWSNAGARPGDALVLTKRLGTGVISTALKRQISEAAWEDAAVESMRTLNKQACEIAIRISAETGDSVHGATDITGFGLLGHAREMALASNVTIEIDHTRIEPLPGALEAIRAGAVPAGLKNNQEFASCSVSMSASVSPETETLLYDPQTSGGLLISIASEHAPALETSLQGTGVPARIVGQIMRRAAQGGAHSIAVL